jgi:hypothetical protein
MTPLPISPAQNKPRLSDGDRGFIGVNMRLHPSQLEEGYAAEAINMRFRNGVAETRLGTVKVGWTNKITAAGIQPWGTVYGVGIFSDPTSGVEYLIVAADGNVYWTRANNYAQTVPLPNGVTITTNVEFVQCFDVLVMFRGTTAAPLVMTSIAAGFTTVAQTGSGTGTMAIPNAARGLFAANRLFVPHGADLVAASDLLDYTRHQIFNDFRINQGAADGLVTIALFGKSTIVCFKEQSVFRVDNVYGSLGSITLSAVTRRYGCVAAKSVVDVGNDLLWLSQGGVASLTLTTEGELQAGTGVGKPPMFSADIQPLIERINWAYASGATGAFWDNKYYLAVPLDDAVVTRHELVPQGVVQTVGLFTVPTVAGKTYRYVKGDSDALVNGAETLTASADFTAAGTTVTVQRALTTSTTASVKQVFKGVNNAVLVYDFTNGAWSGYDTLNDVDVRDFFVATYNNKARLFFISSDGYVNLYEEDYADQLSVPYMDLTVSAVPGAVHYVQIENGTTGTLVTADTTSSTNTANTVGCNTTLAGVLANLWSNTAGTHGFIPGGSWDAPNTAAVKTETGIRFYSTNGVAPNATIAGANWTTTQTRTADIPCALVTRGYLAGDVMNTKRARQVIAQVQTWKPRYSVATVSEGVGETTAHVTDKTRSRTVYDRPFDATAYVERNASDNWATAYRQDYSVGFSTTCTQIQLRSGIKLGSHQEAQHRVVPKARGRAVQVKITNTQGRIRVLAVGYEGLPVDQRRKGIRI